MKTTRIEMGLKPENGTTKGQPFAAGTGGSEQFRIPAMVTLKDGTIVAAADARWNHDGDACGLDTITARSFDSGKNWEYTFANYLGDYGNQMSEYATAFIDPILASDGETVYMLVDLHVGGHGLNTAPLVPKKGNAFTGDGYLKLKARGEEEYNYFLKEGEIFYKSRPSDKCVCDAAKIQGYIVDEYFNLKNSVGEEEGNIFFHAPLEENCPAFQVYPTTYLYLTKSVDGGKTWSAPKLLNLKREDEYFYGAGPGRGLVTDAGRIIFPCYSHDRGVEYTSVIYSDDEGRTWTRSADMQENCSEAALTEVDGTLYLFTRQKYNTPRGYYISKDYGETWAERQDIKGIEFDNSCQMSAITYSRKIDGKTAILLSVPGGYRRLNGRVFIGLVQEDESIEWEYTYHVNEDKYEYSCLTELDEGKIALLYEAGNGTIRYTILGEIKEILLGLDKAEKVL